MTQGRRLSARSVWLALIAVALLGAAALALVGRGGSAGPPGPPPRSAEKRPELMMLTTLPLIFPEEFTLEGGGSRALEALETRYDVVPISVATAESLREDGLLLMAHPLAQPAEALVELDQWVRSGGRLLLLADPKLEWPSERPLGDRLRPPPAFADTGLLAHWRLRLDTPVEAGPAERQLGGRSIVAYSPGELFGSCPISADRLVARCRIGEGEVTIVADADFLNVEQLDGATAGNLDALLVELRRLERK